MKAQDNGDGGPDKDIHSDEDGDDSNAVGGDRMKEFRLWRKFDGRKVIRHDEDDVKTQNIAEVTSILGLGDLSREEQWPYEVFISSAAPSLAYNPPPFPS